MPKHIVILGQQHLCANPRVVKEATTLSDAGYDVSVLGCWIDPALKKNDLQILEKIKVQFFPVFDWTLPGFVSGLSRTLDKLQSRIGHTLFKAIRIDNSWQLGYGISKLRKKAFQLKGDLFIAHSEAGMYVARDLQIQGRKIGIDMEDWFSEDLLPEVRKQRPYVLIHELECELLRNAKHSSCPSHVMSEQLARDYKCRSPEVIYNAFPWSDRQTLDGKYKDRRQLDIPSIHWFSQTLGQGRGLEDLLAALPLMTHEAEIHLRGKPVTGFHEWLMARLPEAWHTRVFIHDLVSNQELLSRIAEHDIGFAGEMKFCRNRELTVTNKILHYLLAGLAVVASDTEGHKEVARQSSGAVMLYPSGDPRALAEKLDYLLASNNRLHVAKTAALAAAQIVFCWERQAPVLLNSIEKALA